MNKNRVYIIAEAGVNHNGDPDLAINLIDIAADAGADAVKFQTFSTELLVSQYAPKAGYQKNSNDDNETQYEMLKKLEISYELHQKLKDHALSRSVDFLSTAFDIDSLRFLQTLNPRYYKIPSGEITNAPLLWQYGKLRKPVILSTGASNLGEIESALAIILHGFMHNHEPSNMSEVWSIWANQEYRKLLKNQVTILHCTSCYPAPLEAINLNALKTLASTFDLPIGYSDHSLGTAVSIGAVALGAGIIEKHFTVDRSLAGPDHFCSLEPGELSSMILDIRMMELALGENFKTCQEVEIKNRLSVRQQLISARCILAGSVFTRDDFTTQRCGEGISPSLIWDLIGKVSMRSYLPGAVINLNE